VTTPTPAGKGQKQAVPVANGDSAKGNKRTASEVDDDEVVARLGMYIASNGLVCGSLDFGFLL
jgi:hypothetical protein